MRYKQTSFNVRIFFNLLLVSIKLRYYQTRSITIHQKIVLQLTRNVYIGAVGLVNENDKGLFLAASCSIMLILLAARSSIFSCSMVGPRYFSTVGPLPRPEKGVFLFTTHWTFDPLHWLRYTGWTTHGKRVER